MVLDAKQSLITAFAEQGLTLDRKALALLSQHVASDEDAASPEALQQAIARLLAAVSAGSASTISGPEAASILEKCAGRQSAGAASVQVIDAFAVPRVKYDPIRSSFYPLPGKGTLHGTAEVR